MAAGQYDNLKIGAIIQARMRSTRLPGKILMPLPYPEGKPLLSWVVDGIRKSRYVNSIILATSQELENDCLEKFSADHGIYLIRGSEEDVLSRFVQAAHKFNLDVVVRLTGDNPIVDTNILDDVIQTHLSKGNAYTKTSGMPIGMNFEIISGKVLIQLPDHDLTVDDKEHVTLFFRNTDLFKKGDLQLFQDEDLSAVRLTVDYPSDFAVMNLVLSFAKDHVADMSLVRRLRLSHSWIFEINAGNVQRRQFEDPQKEIHAAISHLEASGMNHAATILKQHGLS